MHHKMAIVKNVLVAQAAFEALQERNVNLPGMGLIYGKPGYGKTTAITWLVNQYNGVFVRAGATWTPTAMLSTILTELGVEPSGRLNTYVDSICEHLAITGRPLFVDEGDYLLDGSNVKMIETLRDIHDITQVPVMVIGMNGIEKKIKRRLLLARRVTQWVEFKPADQEDARIVADTMCEISVADDLLARLYDAASGSIGLMVVGLARIEQLAKANEWGGVDALTWGEREFFLARASVV